MYDKPDDPFPVACANLTRLIERLCGMPPAMRRVTPGAASYLSADLAIVKELLTKKVQSNGSVWETHPLGRAYKQLEAVAYLPDDY